MDEATPRPRTPWLRSGEFLYGALLFGAAIAAVTFAGGHDPLPHASWPHLLFFLAFGLFTISIGYAHPVFGYVSFDRVAQVSSILVLGPVDAAWINGLASLLHPWQRLRLGVPIPAVVNAALTNAGLMALMMLAGGVLYVAIGGPVPLASLDAATFGAVALMLLAMQAVNEGGIALLVRARGQPARSSLSLFDTTTELLAGLAGVLVAIVWARMEVEVLLLLLSVLAALMLSLKRYAEMRLRLERIVQERTAALQEKSQQLEELATRDQLTGLHNRRYADEFLQREFVRTQRRRGVLTVALADVDHFKTINDCHSHTAGDRVLERVGRLLAEQTRRSDLVARFGGEEFLFCFVDVDEVDATRACENLRLAIEREDWTDISAGLRVTISVGLAVGGGEASAATLLERADARLYRAKQLGRNRVVASADEFALEASAQFGR